MTASTDVSAESPGDSERNAALPVPDDVLRLLRLAYGEDGVGRCGHDLAGHVVETRARLVDAASGQVDASFMYGELLPGGVSKMLARLGVARPLAEADSLDELLELGMGTGAVALQAFLECPGLRRVVGVELSAPRCAAAVAAAARLAAAEPGRFRFEGTEESLPTSASADDAAAPGRLLRRGLLTEEGGNARELELLEGDLGALKPSALGSARAVLLQVVLPPRARERAQALLQHVPDGCRAFLLEDPRLTWCLDEPSAFHPDEAETEELDRYATSWAPSGHRFYVLRADRSRPPVLTRRAAERAEAEAEADGHEL